jgi:hypothetical protein
MVISLWESRGLSITGIEVKSFRGDWVKELKNPQKQELHVPYCDYFYLFTTDEKVAKIDEIPENWGWMTLRGDKIFTLKKAPKLQSKPIPKSLMISMIRRSADKKEFIHREMIATEIEEKVKKAVEYTKIEREREFLTVKKNYEDLKSEVKNFEEESGLKFPFNRWSGVDAKELGKAVKFVLTNDIKDLLSTVIRFRDSLKMLLRNTENSIEEFTKDKE